MTTDFANGRKLKFSSPATEMQILAGYFHTENLYLHSFEKGYLASYVSVPQIKTEQNAA